MPSRALPAGLAIALLLFAAPAWACGEHGRRLAADLHLLNGDARLLQSGDEQPLQQRGLHARIENILGYLPLLTRFYAQECRHPAAPLLDAVDELRRLYAAPDLAGFGKRLEALIRDYPLDTAGLLPVRADPLRLRTGEEIYTTMCRGCHQYTDPDRENPARDLFAMAAAVSAEEFAARLIAGVRGVPLSTLENALSDEDLASLQTFLSHGSGGR